MLLDNIILENNTVNGKSQKELEYTYIGFIQDINAIVENASSVEEYEQWEISTDDSRNKGERSGTIRVRSINKREFVMAVKERERTKTMANSCLETEVPITKDMFEAFKKLAPVGLVKTRYTFPTEGKYKWELDIFTLESGDVYDWCQMDLEVKGELDEMPPFPVGIGEAINAKDRRYKEAVNQIFSRPKIHNGDNILPIRR